MEEASGPPSQFIEQQVSVPPIQGCWACDWHMYERYRFPQRAAKFRCVAEKLHYVFGRAQ